MSQQTVAPVEEIGHKRSGPPGAGNTATALEHTPLRRSRAMSRSGHYTPLGVILNTQDELTPSAAQKPAPQPVRGGGFEPIGQIAARLVAQAEAKR
jgi:hypothetical protein